MRFRACFDESGLNPDENATLVLGGFVGHVEEWERASQAWNDCLKGHPSIDYFSHKEANGLNEQFRKFSRSAADKKITALAQVIAQFRLQGFCVVVPLSGFADRDSAATKGMIGTRPYDWGFLTAISGVLQLMSRLKGDYIVDFVFDDRKELRACCDSYDRMKRMKSSHTMQHAGVCTPRDDKQVAALQMADLLSWEFSHFEHSSVRLEPLQIILTARPIVRLPCYLPPDVADVTSLHKEAVYVKKAADRLLKRIYGDKEKSLELIKDVDQLQKREAVFNLQLDRLTARFDEKGDWRTVVRDFIGQDDEE